VPMEIVAALGRVVKTVRLFRPQASAGSPEPDQG